MSTPYGEPNTTIVVPQQQQHQQRAVVQPVTMVGATPREEYYRRSQLEGCCCCGVHGWCIFFLICWLIGGWYSAYGCFFVIDNEYDESDESDDVDNARWVFYVIGVQELIAGIVAIIGLWSICGFVPRFMRIPFYYCLLCIVMTIFWIIVLATYGVDAWAVYIVDIVLESLIAFLFYRNWKIADEVSGGLGARPNYNAIAEA